MREREGEREKRDTETEREREGGARDVCTYASAKLLPDCMYNSTRGSALEIPQRKVKHTFSQGILQDIHAAKPGQILFKTCR